MAATAAHSDKDHRRSLLAAAAIGVGTMAAIDEIVFHQILGWHHFYDRATPMVGLISDGLLHASELVFLIGGFFMLAELRSRHSLSTLRAWAGFFLGAGGFQLFDGIIDHKVLRVHQVRYVDNLWVYDIAWNAFGLLLVGVGAVLLRRTHTRVQG